MAVLVTAPLERQLGQIPSLTSMTSTSAFVLPGGAVVTLNGVRGLTTAASIWITSAIGILVGIGFWFAAIVGTAATLIVLAAADGKLNKDIAAELGTGMKTVCLWRNRFAKSGLAGIECDAPRGGRPSQSADTAAEIVRVTTTEKPHAATHWSTRTLAKHLKVSRSMVHRVWQANRNWHTVVNLHTVTHEGVNVPLFGGFSFIAAHR